MKKILLTTAAVAALSTSSAFAGTEQGTFYAKVNAGWDKLSNVSIKAGDTNFGKAKSNNDAYLGIGAGYYVMDNARFDLTFDHLFNPTHTLKKTSDDVSTKVKGMVNTLLLNGYMDLGSIDAFKFFVGAGLGVAQVSAKDTTTINGTTSTYKAKSKYNLAYAGHVGAAYELAPGITGELAYSYRVIGKTNNFKDSDGGVLKNSAVTYQGHFVGVGVRFDI